MKLKKFTEEYHFINQISSKLDRSIDQKEYRIEKTINKQFSEIFLPTVEYFSFWKYN